MKLKAVYLLAISGAIIALDQATKMFIHWNFYLGESFTVIENYFDITYVRNLGAAFGFLAQSHPGFREIFFLVMPPIALVIILVILRTVEEKDRFQVIALSLIFGGAIGNYIDRVRFRYVIDFLDFHIQDYYYWPAFNVADMAIVSGVGVLVFLMFFDMLKNKNKVSQPN